MLSQKAIARARKSLQTRLDQLLRHHSSDAGDCRSADVCDVAAAIVQNELESQLVEHGARDLGLITRALERIDAGTYGICDMCKNDIPVQRLEAQPFSLLCVACQSKIEAAKH